MTHVSAPHQITLKALFSCFHTHKSACHVRVHELTDDAIPSAIAWSPLRQKKKMVRGGSDQLMRRSLKNEKGSACRRPGSPGGSRTPVPWGAAGRDVCAAVSLPTPPPPQLPPTKDLLHSRPMSVGLMQENARRTHHPHLRNLGGWTDCPIRAAHYKLLLFPIKVL